MNIEQQLTAPPRVGEQRIVLHNISWRTYEALLHDLRQSSWPRLAYDRGELEIMAPSFNHEYWSSRFKTAVYLICLELDVGMQPAGSTTFRREDLERGLEPDECFYIAQVAAIRGLRELDLTRDPPPDLAIEIDITRSSLDRQSIYAALGVPELWRFDGDTLRVHLRRTDGTYEVSDHSASFPQLPLAELLPVLRETFDLDEIAFTRAFRPWLRSRLTRAPEGPGAPTGGA